MIYLSIKCKACKQLMALHKRCHFCLIKLENEVMVKIINREVARIIPYSVSQMEIDNDDINNRIKLV